MPGSDPPAPAQPHRGPTRPTVESCDACGFDGHDWTDAEAIEAVDGLPARWARAIEGLAPAQLVRRPIEDMWSIAEYTDHVREVAFGMRLLLEVALDAPGTDLGEPPESTFDPVPRRLDAQHARSGFESEIATLTERLRAVPRDRWSNTCTVGGNRVDVHWTARHILHDVTHHLGDVERLRAALGQRSVR